MFWDGGQTFRVRFASTKPQGVWRWTSASEPVDAGLNGLAGTIQASPNVDGKTIFDRHGFWRIPSGERNLVHADGTSRQFDVQVAPLRDVAGAALGTSISFEDTTRRATTRECRIQEK